MTVINFFFLVNRLLKAALQRRKQGEGVKESNKIVTFCLY